MRLFVVSQIVVLCLTDVVVADPITFANDYPGFQAAAGSLSIIDFEALPDGTPSVGHAGTPITAIFNYDTWGAHFSAPVENPIICGNVGSGFSLCASVQSPSGHTWIIADLMAPAAAVGIFFPGGTALRAYDATGGEIASVEFSASGPGHFLGIVSNDVPIGRVIVNRGTSAETIESFVFRSVPEPGTAALLAFGTCVVARRRLRGRISVDRQS